MFMSGFLKRASLAGGMGGGKFLKGIKSGLSTSGKGGLSIGARPRTGVTVTGPVKAPVLPLPHPVNASQNLQAVAGKPVRSAAVMQPTNASRTVI